MSAVVTLLAGCGGSQPPLGGPANQAAVGVKPEQIYPSIRSSVLHSFKGYPNDGAYPETALLDLNGVFYGSTFGGGKFGGGDVPPRGCGTLFSLTASGAETMLYSFKCLSHSQVPPQPSGLIDVNGTLYGTTRYGGATRDGTAFSIATSGKEALLYSFKGIPDGAGPSGDLMSVDGALYGATSNGGNPGCGSLGGCGTIFTITTSGKETILYRFKNAPDGAEPHSRLLNVSGTLYGTTFAGGTSGAGTVFKATTSGAETVLHSFGHRPGDGIRPNGGLINVNDTLYGTTCCGGADGHGAVFAITRSGREKVLYSFRDTPDGAEPNGALVMVSGTLYGTTYSGGLRRHGTVFAVTTSGKETVLRDFPGGRGDGSHPRALTSVKGTLYGTAIGGGPNLRGTVFLLTP